MAKHARQEKATTLPPAERAREIALRLLTFAPRSSAQLREALIAREVEPQIVDEVIERYKQVGLLDDAELAARIARTRHLEKGAAPRLITQELQRKGFEPEHIDHALAQITEESQLETARSLAKSRWEKSAALAPQVRTRRVVGFLARKGYSPSLAFALVKDLERADIEGHGIFT